MSAPRAASSCDVAVALERLELARGQLRLYVRRTEHHDRIRKALGGTVPADDPDDPNDPEDDDGAAGVLVPIR